MTDETPEHEPEEQEKQDEPREAQQPPIRYRGKDGEWHQIQDRRRPTGDPEVDAIWRMSFRELEKILDDESHPLHEKAKQVAAEMVQPIVDAANEIVRPLTDSVLKSIETSKLMEALAPKLDMKHLTPAFDTWAAKLLPEMPRFELSEGLLDSIAAVKRVEPVRPLELTPPPVIDFDAIEPPDASLLEIQEAAEARAHDMRSKQIEIMTELLIETRASAESGKEALTISKQALGETRSSKRAGWMAAWAAIGAAVISGLGIIVTVLATR